MSIRIAVMILLVSCSSVMSETWSESFESGFGRLSETRFNGDSVFTYDASSQSIDATFVRYHHSVPSNDERFALLEGGSFDFRNTIATFSVAITPTSATNGSNVSAKVGFLNSTGPGTEVAIVRFARDQSNILPQFAASSFDPVAGIPFSFGETYFIEATLDGPGLRFVVNVYRGVDASGVWLGQIDRGISPGAILVVDAFGLPGSGTGSVASQFHAFVHEVSVTVDRCPDDPNKLSPGACGCGVLDADTDNDGTADCLDGCPADSNKTSPGICGCGNSDAGDSDGDGVPDCVDQCHGVDDAVFAPCDPAAIPTLSEWGMVILMLSLLVGFKLKFDRRTAPEPK